MFIDFNTRKVLPHISIVVTLYSVKQHPNDVVDTLIARHHWNGRCCGMTGWLHNEKGFPSRTIQVSKF
ncbi:unnamed protein product [Arabidopsis thaliana]|uniref:Uncharacterized protein n=1 Tax=Arabidopsis thaliana TaxID=3702 RepID=A0A5S9X9X6_ARATH|nr:unnamed protein product [Arabidopsis thaliana]